MTTYRTGNHHGVTICVEGDGSRCGRPDHDCDRGHLVAVVVNGDQALAERICELLNGEGELVELRRLRANALAMAEEYDRTPRPIASLAVASMLRDWCYAMPGTDFSATVAAEPVFREVHVEPEGEA